MITLLVGSWNTNKMLAEMTRDALAAKNIDATIINLNGLNLPLYTSDNDSAHGVPQAVADLLPTLQNSRGFIAICPEYNGSVPPVFNNFIAWVSRSSKNWRECFNGKGAAVMSFSGAGSNVLQILRLQLSYIGLNVVGRQLLASEGKPPRPESIEAIIDELVKISIT